ncbi:MAG: hypothetical protein FWH36_05905 [Lentimicrobiaceae bacterium]|nr:hypothetical protein [Lentimicrobiaceae bacterium]
MKRLAYFGMSVLLIFCGAASKKGEISLKWADNLTEDFSFTDNWSYPEGIYRNGFGQLSCDGFGPPEIDEMKDKNGKIYEDSLESFYKLVDTTHLFHNIKSEAWTYEWAGTNYITVERKNKDTVVCFTQTNAATHSSLHLIITKNTVRPTIVLNSIDCKTGTKIYYCKSGNMLIHKGLWNRGILKAAFYFEFHHNENPNKMYWKGIINAKIENK